MTLINREDFKIINSTNTRTQTVGLCPREAVSRSHFVQLTMRGGRKIKQTSRSQWLAYKYIMLFHLWSHLPSNYVSQNGNFQRRICASARILTKLLYSVRVHLICMNTITPHLKAMFLKKLPNWATPMLSCIPLTSACKLPRPIACFVVLWSNVLSRIARGTSRRGHCVCR